MGKRKLVWVEYNEKGEPDVTPDMLSLCPDVQTLGAALLILKSLPSALLIGAEEREELARIVRQSVDGRIMNMQAYFAADTILSAGYRKVTAVDREALIEEMAQALAAAWCHEGDTTTSVEEDARALLARVEGDTSGG